MDRVNKKDYISQYLSSASILAKLNTRNKQYEIALEGLKTIKDSNDPMGIAEKTIIAMLDCLPE